MPYGSLAWMEEITWERRREHGRENLRENENMNDRRKHANKSIIKKTNYNKPWKKDDQP